MRATADNDTVAVDDEGADHRIGRSGGAAPFGEA
jgi:hypothetical protein